MNYDVVLGIVALILGPCAIAWLIYQLTRSDPDEDPSQISAD